LVNSRLRELKQLSIRASKLQADNKNCSFGNQVQAKREESLERSARLHHGLMLRRVKRPSRGVHRQPEQGRPRTPRHKHQQHPWSVQPKLL